jgi:peptidoglycan DL-endopeptidase CwlO
MQLPMMPLSALSPLMGLISPQRALPGPGEVGGPEVTGAEPGRGVQVRSARGAAAVVVRRALSQLGVPYVWGGGGKNGPSGGGFDCSSLAQYAYAGVGVDLPRTTYDQVHVGRAVPRWDVQAGDLVFSNWDGGRPEHVQLAISPTQVVEAPTPGGHVQVHAIPVDHIVVKRVLS